MNTGDSAPRVDFTTYNLHCRVNISLLRLLSWPLHTPFSGQFRRQCMHFGNSAGNFGVSSVRRPVGYDSAAAMSKLAALLPKCMQIVQNWSEKRCIVGPAVLCVPPTCETVGLGWKAEAASSVTGTGVACGWLPNDSRPSRPRLSSPNRLLKLSMAPPACSTATYSSVTG